MKLADLNINHEELAAARETMHFGAIDLPVRKFLPIADKSDLVSYVIRAALDPNTNTCSPIRLQVYFDIAVAHWYADIDIDEEDPLVMYDDLEWSGFTDAIAQLLGHEYTDTMNLINDTVKDFTQYNNSFAGALSNMQTNAGEIDAQLSELLNEVKDKKGLELLDEIKNVVGTD